jgi:AcrR family transcriptional regulator
VHSVPRPPSDGDGAAAAPGPGSARERLIITAERLFAERGMRGVSLREIGTEAGQRNNSASQYHFGSKAGLIEAIFAYRMGTINQRRLAAIAELDQRGSGLELRGLVEAYIHPLAETVGDTDGEGWYVRFLANVLADPSATFTSTEHRDFTAGLDEVLRRLDRVLRDVPEPIRSERIRVFGAMVVNVLAAREGSWTTTAGEIPIPLLLADLVDMAVGLLAAPVSAKTHRELGEVEQRRA